MASGYSPGTPVDRSSTIASGGVAQSLLAADQNRNGFSVQNLSNGNLYINYVGGTAVSAANGSSITIAPGVLYETPSWGTDGIRPVHAVSIIGATTAQAFACVEW